MPSSPLPGLDACAAFAERVVGTSGGRPGSPSTASAPGPAAAPGKRCRARRSSREHHDGEQTITLPRRYRTKGVVLHELVHWALFAQPDLPHHGGTFTRLLLDATEEFLGVERADALAAAYSVERVRVGRPPRPGPDGRLRYGWDERLRLGRGRALHVAWLGPAGPDRAVGTFLGFERSGATLRLDVDDTLHRIPTRSVWSVDAPQ